MKDRIRVLSPAGFIHEFETPEFKDRHELLAALPLFEDELLDAGYTPAPAASVIQPAPAQPAAVSGNAFAARELVCEVLDKKPYWKIMGPPPFQKFGLRVWPETLEAAGIEVEKLDILKGLDLAGFTAYWEYRPNGKGGQARVVVNLSK